MGIGLWGFWDEVGSLSGIIIVLFYSFKHCPPSVCMYSSSLFLLYAFLFLLYSFKHLLSRLGNSVALMRKLMASKYVVPIKKKIFDMAYMNII